MWFGHRKGGAHAKRAQGPIADAAQLVAEAEAFLSGDILSHLQRSGRSIPDWAWLNALAHGDLSGRAERKTGL